MICIVNVCLLKKGCYFKHFKNNGIGHAWKKALNICEFNGKCNQKKTLDHIDASRRYGIKK